LRQRRTLAARAKLDPKSNPGVTASLLTGHISGEEDKRRQNRPIAGLHWLWNLSRRIAQTHILRLHCQIEIELTVVRGSVTAKGDIAAAHAGGESFDLQPVFD